MITIYAASAGIKRELLREPRKPWPVNYVKKRRLATEITKNNQQAKGRSTSKANTHLERTAKRPLIYETSFGADHRDPHFLASFPLKSELQGNAQL